MPIVLDPRISPLAAGAFTAAGLVAELAMRLGDFAYGTITATSTDTNYLEDNTRPEPDNTFRMGWLSYHTLEAEPAPPTNDGMELRITGYDGAVNVGRFLLGNGNPGAGLVNPAQPGDTYSVHMHWSKRRKLAALNRAIRRLPQNFWRRIEDTSITTEDHVWTYPLPLGMVNLNEVWVQVSTNLSGPGALAQGQDGRGFPFMLLSGWAVRTHVEPGGAVSSTLQLNDLPPWPRTLRLVGSGIQPLLVKDTDVASVGQDDYDQRLQEYLLSYAAAYLWLEGANGAPIDQAARSTELFKLNMSTAAELRNELVMPPPALEVDTPETTGRRGWGDNPYYFAALSTPGPR